MLCPATSLKQKEHLLARGVLQQNTTNQHQAATMSCSKPIQSISFAEIIRGRDSTIRVTHDHLIYAVDLVIVVSDLERNQAGLALRRVIEKNLLSIKMIERNTGGKGNARTQLVNLKDALQLIMVLPGEMAKTVRAQIGDIMTKFFAGDESLVDQIHANASSTSPIAQMARESLGMTQGDDPVAVGFKRRREELELLKLEEEIKGLAQNRVMTLQDKLEQIRDPVANRLDERTRLMFQDAYMNMLINSQSGAATHQATLTNGTSNAPISIGSVAAELGYKPTTNDAKRIGVDIKKRYLRLHNKPPPKHDQLCEGRVTQVNSYTEQDKPLLIEALHDYFAPRSYTSNSSSCSSSVASIS